MGNGALDFMRECKVFVHGRFAGVLSETDFPKEYVFKYDELYLNDDSTENVCLAMPKRHNEYRSKFLFPYFANLLSEGENRLIQSSLLHIDKDDDFGFLLETATHDTVGAVTILPIKTK